MLTAERRRRLLNIITGVGAARTTELAAALGVSDVTIRADLTDLERQGQVRRTHGGAVATTQGELAANFATRVQLNASAKQRIARAATALVGPSQTIIVDGGTTMFAFAQAMSPIPDLTIFTHGINVAQQLASLDGAEVHVLGGVISTANMETIGGPRDDSLNNVIAHHAFLGAGGIDADLDVTESSLALVMSKLNMMRAARRKVLLADSSKWTVQTRAKAMPITAFDLVITDSDLPEHTQTRIRDLGVSLQIV